MLKRFVGDLWTKKTLAFIFFSPHEAETDVVRWFLLWWYHHWFHQKLAAFFVCFSWFTLLGFSMAASHLDFPCLDEFGASTSAWDYMLNRNYIRIFWKLVPFSAAACVSHLVMHLIGMVCCLWWGWLIKMFSCQRVLRVSVNWVCLKSAMGFMEGGSVSCWRKWLQKFNLIRNLHELAWKFSGNCTLAPKSPFILLWPK